LGRRRTSQIGKATAATRVGNPKAGLHQVARRASFALAAFR